MCIIIYKPADVTLSLSTVARGFRRNEDGWGLVARTTEGLLVRRGCGADALEHLLDAYDDLRAHEVTLHCRIATTGEVNIQNTHPFEVVSNLWMFHNGTIGIDRSSDESMCDSAHVARALRDALGAEATAALRDVAYQARLAKYAGLSKLVFVDECGVTIVNESLGYWEGGCWYSNDSADEHAPSRLWTYDYDLAEIDRFGEEARFEDTLSFIESLRDAEVSEIIEYVCDHPEIAAEALFHLINSRGTRTLALSATA